MDPLVDETGQPYAYTGGDPVDNTDPSGLEDEGDWDPDAASDEIFMASDEVQPFSAFSAPELQAIGDGLQAEQAQEAVQSTVDVSCTEIDEKARAAEEEAQGGVYTLRDEDGNVVRTGRSSNLAAREAAHFNDPVLGEYEFNVEYRTDVYAEQRGVEQMLYDQYPGAQAANGGFNYIRGISPTNSSGPFYMQAARAYLEELGGG